jgi:hypothetical protein
MISFGTFVSFWSKAIIVQLLLALCTRNTFIALILHFLMNKAPLSVIIIRCYPFCATAFIFFASKFIDCFKIDSIINAAVALTTFYAALIALWKDEYLEYTKRPILSIKTSNKETIVNGQKWNRIKIENKGKSIAKNVSIKISCNDTHFIPVRLKWTHIGKPLQNIEPNDFALCDTVVYHDQGFYLPTEIKPYDGYTSFGRIKKNFTLTISADNFAAIKKNLCIGFENNTIIFKLE